MLSVKKIGLLVLTSFMLAGVTAGFTACNGREAGRPGRRSTTANWPGPAPQDLGGMVFKIMSLDPHIYFPAESEIGTPIGDAKLAFMEGLMEDFNITFEVIPYPVWGAMGQLQPAAMAGDMLAHVILATQFEMGQLIGAGLIGDLSAIPTLNLDGDLWWQSVHSASTIGGEVKATAGIHTIELLMATMAMFYHKGLWNELNLPDPYELVRSGEWTWEKVQEFSAIAQQDLTGDGIVDSINDRWGISSIPDNFVRSCFVSQGGLYFDVDPETGRLFTPLGTPDGIAIADWMRSFTEMPGLWDRSNDRAFSDRVDMFKTGNALFYIDMLTYYGLLVDMDDDWGMLPMPKRNPAQHTYLNDMTLGASVIGIPRTNNQLEATGIILEAMNARFETVRRLRMEEIEFRLRSDDDIEMMLEYIQPNAVFDIGRFMHFSGLPGFSTPGNLLVFYTAFHTINDYASEIESHREMVEMEANEAFFGTP